MAELHRRILVQGGFLGEGEALSTEKSPEQVALPELVSQVAADAIASGRESGAITVMVIATMLACWIEAS